MTSPLEKAAAPTLERIRQDRERAPPRIQPLLAYLETHLFDPNLDGTRLKQACGIRDNSVPISFHQALSLPPYAYIEDCRMEVACRLLRDTDLKVWQIAQLLGYSTLQVFSRAFDRWAGIRPSVFRGRSRAVAASESRRRQKTPRPVDGGSAISVETLQKAVNGRLPKHEADELSSRLAELYPESFSRSSASP